MGVGMDGRAGEWMGGRCSSYFCSWPLGPFQVFAYCTRSSVLVSFLVSLSLSLRLSGRLLFVSFVARFDPGGLPLLVLVPLLETPELADLAEDQHLHADVRPERDFAHPV